MKFIDSIEFITRKGIGQENVDKLKIYLQSEDYKNLSEKEKEAVFNNYFKRRKGMNYREILDNLDVLVELTNSIENQNVFRELIKITGFISEQQKKKILIMLLDKFKNDFKNAYSNYADEKIMSIIKKIQITMETIGISDKEKLKFVEEYLDYLSEDELLLASVYSYFDIHKQQNMSYIMLLFKLKNIDERFGKLNLLVEERTKNRNIARKVSEKTRGVIGRELSFEHDNDLEPELKEKLNDLDQLGIYHSELADYINDKGIFQALSIEQIVRLSQDKRLNSYIRLITDDEKRAYVFKLALLRPNANVEITDFILNIKNYTELFKNTTLEQLERCTNIKRLIDIIVQDKSNSFNIDSLDKVESYSKIRVEKCISILSGNIAEISSLDEFMKSDSLPKSVLSQKKEALYQLFFGLNSEQVENLVKKYGEDVFKPEMNTKSMSIKELKTLEVIRTLRKLYQVKNVDKICEQVLNNKELIEKLKSEDIQINYASLENNMIELYNNKMNEVLYNPHNSVPSREIVYEGQPSEVTINNLFRKLFKAKNKLVEKMSNFKGDEGTKSGLFGLTTTYLFPDDSAKGRKVKVYEIDPEKPFCMLARVDGAYGYYEEPYDYSHNKFYDLSYHGNCKSFITNDLLAIARWDNYSGPIFGYTSQQSNELLMMAPWDIASCNANRSLAPQRAKWDLSERGIQYRLPKYLKNHTRHNHNEVVCDRLIFDKTKKEFKADKPNYVIYIKDFDENTIIEDEEWYNISKKYGIKRNTSLNKRFDELRAYSEKSGIPLEELIYDDKYRQSVKAAAQYNIPLLIIDRQKIIENEHRKMNNAIEEFKKENDPQRLAVLIPNLITRFENNAVSTRFSSEKIKKTMFNEDQRHNLFNIIKEKISSSGDNKEKLENIFENVILSEEQKYRTNYGNFVVDSEKLDIIPLSIIQELDNIRLKRSEEFTRKELPNMIKAISKTNFYDGNKYHSIEHIQKVMIFANYIANDKGFTADQKRILIAAAAFHDSGRGKDTDGKDIHGVASAFKVQEYYKSHPNNPFGITEENLAIIQAAIELHEINDRDKEKYEIKFKSIANKYGIRDTENSEGYFETDFSSSNTEYEFLRCLSDVLKDADALDRFRFAHRSRLNPEYLRTQESKKYIEFANKLNKKFASKVLEEIYHATAEELRGHRIISSLSFFRQKKEKENASYVEPHIDVDTLLKDVYGFSNYEEVSNNSDVDKEEDTISFMRKRRDFAMYEDLTPMDITNFMEQIFMTASQLIEKENEEDMR